LTESDYTYIIVGAGAAGLQLALAINRDSFFNHCNILIIEKENIQRKDKRWSFWENGVGHWDELIYQSWSNASFYGPTAKRLQFNLEPYTYKSLHSSDFNQFAKEQIAQSTNISLIIGDVVNVSQNKGRAIVRTLEKEYSCTHCFDSRIQADWNKDEKGHTTLWQHFKGLTIEFEQKTFDSSEFTMMDFRLRHLDSTSFFYVLPTDENRALVEFTLFTKDVFNRSEDYDQYLQNYISTYISQNSYSIMDIEEGKIPMTTFPFHKKNKEHITKIGTAGSWVRPSTGYSFKYIEKYVNQIITNIKLNKSISNQLLSRKTRWLDAILLEVLSKENHLGPAIFETQYSKNSIEQIFKFLDGETNISEDLSMISKFDKMPFLKAVSRYLFRNNRIT